MAIPTPIEAADDYLHDFYFDGYEKEYIKSKPLLDAISQPDNLAMLNGWYEVQIAPGQGYALGSDNVGRSQTYSSQSTAKRFAMLPSEGGNEAVLEINRLEGSLRGNRYAFGSLIEAEVDSKWDGILFNRSRELIRGSTARGQIKSIAANVITLTAWDDAILFEINTTIMASANLDGSAPQAGSTYVTAVDQDAGTITVNNAADITGLAANQYLFGAGEISFLPLEGLGVSTPLIAPVLGTDSFRQLDRGIDPLRLAGARLPSARSKAPVEQLVGALCARMYNAGAKADFVLMSSTNSDQARQRMAGKVFFQEGKEPEYGFNSWMMNTALGPLTVIADPACPSNQVWVGNMKSQEISCQGPLVHFTNASRFPNSYWYVKPGNNQIAVRMQSVGNYRQIRPLDFGTFGVASS